VISSHTISVKTQGFNDTHNLTPRVEEIVRAEKLTSGLVTVFVPGSTAGITTIEFESGVVEDLKKAIERLAPQNIHYDHDRRWGDGNGFSHVRAALLGPSLTVPVTNGELRLGTWQQIVLIDFDNRPREREIIVHLAGDSK
jgi:secondary thiamine-phosphate synthase enzyme